MTWATRAVFLVKNEEAWNTFQDLDRDQHMCSRNIDTSETVKECFAVTRRTQRQENFLQKTWTNRKNKNAVYTEVPNGKEIVIWQRNFQHYSKTVSHLIMLSWLNIQGDAHMFYRFFNERPLG